MAARERPGVHVSIVWESFLSEHGAATVGQIPGPDARAHVRVHPGHELIFPFYPSVELEFEASPAELDEICAGLVRAAVQGPADGDVANWPAAASGSPWDRASLLGVWPGPAGGGTRWHASMLARPGDFERAKRALSTLKHGFPGIEHRVSPRAERPLADDEDAVLFDSRASLPTEIRWVPPAQALSQSSAQSRALECVLVAALARELEGWSFVPASVDLGGRIEPAYLYTCADFAAAKQRFDALRAAIATAHVPKNASAVLAERIKFAGAQLQQEEFRLHAMHGSELERFEAEFVALRELRLDSLLPPDLAAGDWWSVVGPRLAWSSALAEVGKFRVRSTAFTTDQIDSVLEDDLARMWASLGGVERWRDLKTLRVLGVLTAEDGNSRQGVEQWIDFADGRMALSQAVGPVETVIAATPTAAWILDGSSGVELDPAQARKFRGRAERAWFTLLRRLAQPDHDGLSLVRENGRLILNEGTRALCWIEIDGAGSLNKLGYRLEPNDPESLYEFQDWKIKGPLAYPARMLQLDRKATFEIQHIEPGAKLDPLLWVRKQR